MDFRRLEAFCKVYERLSFSRAGEELFLSQPTISAHIQALEKELGTRLFDRLGRAVSPTPAGDALYQRTKDIFQLLELAKTEVHSLMHRVTGEVILGASTIPAMAVLPRLLAGFVTANEEVSIRLETGTSAAIIEAVAEGRCMLGVVGAKEERSDLHYDFLLQDALICVAAPTFARANDSLAFAARVEQPWIMRGAGSGTRLAMEQALEKRGVPLHSLRVAIEVGSTQTLLACAAAGMGLAVTSRLAAGDMLARGALVEVSLPALEMERGFWCVTHAQRMLFPAVSACVEHLLQHAPAVDAAGKA